MTTGQSTAMWRPLSWLLVLVLGGCVTAPPTLPTQGVDVAPGVRLVLPSPEALGHSITATQLVTVRYGDQSLVFEAHLDITPQRFLLVCLDTMGRRALTVTRSGGAVTVEAAPWLPATIDPHNILADIELIYWPADSLRTGLAGGELSEDGGHRSIMVGRTEVVRIEYESGGRGAWTGRQHLSNLAWNYDIAIDSTESPP